MELLKCVYFCTRKSVIKAGNNKFQDLINVPRISIKIYVLEDKTGKTNYMHIYVYVFLKTRDPWPQCSPEHTTNIQLNMKPLICHENQIKVSHLDKSAWLEGYFSRFFL